MDGVCVVDLVLDACSRIPGRSVMFSERIMRLFSPFAVEVRLVLYIWPT